MTWHEHPLVFDCAGERLIGIVTQPEQAADNGIVIVVGGPQYRAGSHRQFTLLARQLAEQGIVSIRFDYRGMGDSEGGPRNFEVIDADIRAAVDALMKQVPKLRAVTLWGLCDAASAALYYGHADARVNRLVLLNPWVHSEAGAARVRLKHYYLSRLLSKSFWLKLLSGKVKVGASVGNLAQSARQASGEADTRVALTDPRHGGPGYIDRMLDGLKRFGGEVQIILSGQDLTAQEFVELTRNDKGWRKACRNQRIAFTPLKEANHTFSTHTWRDQVGVWTGQWIGRSERAPD